MKLVIHVHIDSVRGKDNTRQFINRKVLRHEYELPEDETFSDAYIAISTPIPDSDLQEIIIQK